MDEQALIEAATKWRGARERVDSCAHIMERLQTDEAVARREYEEALNELRKARDALDTVLKSNL